MTQTTQATRSIVEKDEASVAARYLYDRWVEAICAFSSSSMLLLSHGKAFWGPDPLVRTDLPPLGKLRR
eukprot:6202421-Pleurochrysis_carterae.AAC.2